jgi:hypothetical protein
VIRLGLRLTLGGGREAAARLVVTAASVAVGVCLLLITLAGINATHAQNMRYAWLNTGFVTDSSTGSAGSLWWLARSNSFDGQTIGRVDVAATGTGTAPVPPGIPRLPGPGEFYASPALSELLRSTPAAELADRFPGHQIGTIGDAALPSPDLLIIIVGGTPDELSQLADVGARQVTRIATADPASCTGCVVGTNTNGMALILSVVAGALIVPLLILIATATRLAAARREQRFAAMRLVGATPQQVSLIAAVESTAAAVLGVAAGFGLFGLLRSPVAAFPFTGQRFFPADMTLTLVNVLLVAVGVPVAAAAAARLALRRVQISPLGVSRRVTPRPPRAWRLIPLAAGLGELAYFVGRRPETTNGQIRAYMSGFLVIMVGLMIAGPWLTLIGSRLLARRSNRPATLIASRRLADNPRAGFRSISGLVVALFVGSVAVGIITTIVAERGTAVSPQVGSTVFQDLADGYTQSGEPASPSAPVPQSVLAELRSTPGVRAVTVIHINPLGTKDPGTEIPATAGLVSCAQLDGAPIDGRCADGAQVAAISSITDRLFRRPLKIWPADISADQLAGLPVQSVFVTTDGSTAAIERAKTILTVAYPERSAAATIDEEIASVTAELRGFEQLADMVILASFVIAGCSLAVSVAAGLSERQRPFSLLRLTGVPLGVLRRVVALESAVPLLFIAVLATGMGFLAAQLFLRSQMDYTLHPPGGGYYLTVLIGLVASLGVIAATGPLLKRITGPEIARNE